jgi:ribose transport system substrate-binding protein
MRSRLVLAAVAIAASGVVVTACGGSSSSSSTSGGGGKLKNVAVSMYARDNPFFAEVVKGIQYEAKRKGVSVAVVWAENDPGQEVTNIQNLITRQPDGLIVSPIDPNALIPPVKQAKQAGIPTVIVTDDIAPSGRQYQLTSMSSDYSNTGRIKAQYIVDQLHGKGKVAVVHLIRGLAFTEEQWKGAESVFSKNPGIQIVGQIYAGAAASDKGLNAAENFLTAHPDLNAIYVDNDPLALGVIQAIKQRHVGHKVIVVGADGTPDAMNELKDKTLDLTIDFCGFNEGVRAIDALWNYKVNGKVDTQKPPQQTITQQNVAKQATALLHGCDGP